MRKDPLQHISPITPWMEPSSASDGRNQDVSEYRPRCSVPTNCPEGIQVDDMQAA